MQHAHHTPHTIAAQVQMESNFVVVVDKSYKFKATLIGGFFLSK
jgi:hypothetical protein